MLFLLCMQSIGNDDDTVESSSAEIMQTEEGFAPVFFDPRPLTNLVLIDELESLSPVMDMQASLIQNHMFIHVHCLCCCCKQQCSCQGCIASDFACQSCASGGASSYLNM